MKQNDFVFFMRSVICNFENNKITGPRIYTKTV